MPESDPKRDFAVGVVRTLREAGFEALWAGGCVRDLLLGHPPDDYDVATNARPEQVRELFGERRTLAIGASFGVILVRAPRRSGAGDVEVATFRTEGPYLDGRRPQHVAFATAEEDAQRRDFTINGMFYDPLTNEVRDFVGGRQDLDRGIVRAIGDPRARLVEDKLRMLRAVRMTARFAFLLEPATAAAVREMAPEILVVSSERITQELKKMLAHFRRGLAMNLARDLGLLAVILPELQPVLLSASPERWNQTVAMLERLEQPGFELAMSVLLFHVAADQPPQQVSACLEGICRRLRFSNDETRQVAWLGSRRQGLRGAPQWPLSRLKRLLAEPFIEPLLVQTHIAAQAVGEDCSDVQFCEDYLRTTPRAEIDPPPLLSGSDLIRIGLTPGARFKELLEQVRDAQLEGKLASTQAALEFVRAWYSTTEGR